MSSWIIPTLHPASLIRDNTLQLAVLSDLQKAMRIHQDGGPTLVPACYRAGQSMPDYSIFPTTGVVLEWLAQHRGQTLSIDIESTYQGQIMCLGIWPVDTALTDEGICIPFCKKGGEKYWNIHHELAVKQAVFAMLSNPTWPKIGQNFAGFDVPMMQKAWGVQTRGVLGDTMIAHWCCMPELPHGLAFLSSIFTDLSPFKREVHTNESEKDDVDKWSAVQDYDDRNLREYCLLDTFATALTWTALVEIMA
jgi:hypothetical protein